MDRLKSFAKTIVEHCCAVQPGERVLVEVTGCEDALAAEVIRAVYDAGRRAVLQSDMGLPASGVAGARRG